VFFFKFTRTLKFFFIFFCIFAENQKKMKILCAGCGDQTEYQVGSVDEDLFFRVGGGDRPKLFFCDPHCWLDVRDKDAKLRSVTAKPPPLSLFAPWYEKQGARFTREDINGIKRRLGLAPDPVPEEDS
jgi:hypothetical protein